MKNGLPSLVGTSHDVAAANSSHQHLPDALAPAQGCKTVLLSDGDEQHPRKRVQQQQETHLSPDDYECAICTEVLLDPVVGACGHDFCRTCLEQWRQVSSSAGVRPICCPICRTKLSSTLGVCQRLKAVVESCFPAQIAKRRAEAEAIATEALYRSKQLLALQARLIPDIQALQSTSRPILQGTALAHSHATAALPVDLPPSLPAGLRSVLPSTSQLQPASRDDQLHGHQAPLLSMATLVPPPQWLGSARSDEPQHVQQFGRQHLSLPLPAPALGPSMVALQTHSATLPSAVLGSAALTDAVSSGHEEVLALGGEAQQLPPAARERLWPMSPPNPTTAAAASAVISLNSLSGPIRLGSLGLGVSATRQQYSCARRLDVGTNDHRMALPMQPSTSTVASEPPCLLNQRPQSNEWQPSSMQAHASHAGSGPAPYSRQQHGSSEHGAVQASSATPAAAAVPSSLLHLPGSMQPSMQPQASEQGVEVEPLTPRAGGPIAVEAAERFFGAFTPTASPMPQGCEGPATALSGVILLQASPHTHPTQAGMSSSSVLHGQELQQTQPAHASSSTLPVMSPAATSTAASTAQAVLSVSKLLSRQQGAPEAAAAALQPAQPPASILSVPRPLTTLQAADGGGGSPASDYNLANPTFATTATQAQPVSAAGDRELPVLLLRASSAPVLALSAAQGSAAESPTPYQQSSAAGQSHVNSSCQSCTAGAASTVLHAPHHAHPLAPPGSFGRREGAALGVLPRWCQAERRPISRCLFPLTGQLAASTSHPNQLAEAQPILDGSELQLHRSADMVSSRQDNPSEPSVCLSVPGPCPVAHSSATGDQGGPPHPRGPAVSTQCSVGAPLLADVLLLGQGAHALPPVCAPPPSPHQLHSRKYSSGATTEHPPLTPLSSAHSAPQLPTSLIVPTPLPALAVELSASSVNLLRTSLPDHMLPSDQAPPACPTVPCQHQGLLTQPPAALPASAASGVAQVQSSLTPVPGILRLAAGLCQPQCQSSPWRSPMSCYNEVLDLVRARSALYSFSQLPGPTASPGPAEPSSSQPAAALPQGWAATGPCRSEATASPLPHPTLPSPACLGPPGSPGFCSPFATPPPHAAAGLTPHTSPHQISHHQAAWCHPTAPSAAHSPGLASTPACRSGAPHPHSCDPHPPSVPSMLRASCTAGGAGPSQTPGPSSSALQAAGVAAEQLATFLSLHTSGGQAPLSSGPHSTLLPACHVRSSSNTAAAHTLQPTSLLQHFHRVSADSSRSHGMQGAANTLPPQAPAAWPHSLLSSHLRGSSVPHTYSQQSSPLLSWTPLGAAASLPAPPGSTDSPAVSAASAMAAASAATLAGLATRSAWSQFVLQQQDARVARAEAVAARAEANAVRAEAGQSRAQGQLERVMAEQELSESVAQQQHHMLWQQQQQQQLLHQEQLLQQQQQQQQQRQLQQQQQQLGQRQWQGEGHLHPQLSPRQPVYAAAQHQGSLPSPSLPGSVSQYQLAMEQQAATYNTNQDQQQQQQQQQQQLHLPPQPPPHPQQQQLHQAGDPSPDRDAVLPLPSLHERSRQTQPWHAVEQDKAIRAACSSAVASTFVTHFAQQLGSKHPRAAILKYVKAIEQELYHTAASRQEYSDLSTLQDRVVQHHGNITQQHGPCACAGSSVPYIGAGVISVSRLCTFASGAPWTTGCTMALVAAVNVYPIKSCRGLSVKAVVITETGLRWDRQWMVVKESTGKMISQREVGKLALVVPSLPDEALISRESTQGVLTVEAPGMATPLQVPLQLPATPAADNMRKVTVWEWTGHGLDEGEQAAAWFTQYLGVPSRLVRYLGNQGTAAAAEPGAEPVVRPTDPVYAQDSTTAFSDGFPILLATEAALDDLNKRLAESDGAATMAGLLPLPMARFRPNIILKGTEAWEEDRWRSVLLHPRVKAAGSPQPDVAGAEMADVVELESVKPCSRQDRQLGSPSVAAAAADTAAAAAATAATPRAAAAAPAAAAAAARSQLGYTTKGFKYAVHFGWNLVPSPGALGAIISVGDAASFKDTQRSF
ncbi:hypothetical protein QJQ45_017881 [Haematococcus lacustris]|nr:hypothetical protein QJQ45_017881 [Haematococcus lacustris]